MQQLSLYVDILRRRGWIIVLLGIITAAAAFGYSTFRERTSPVYRSTIRILVEPARPDFGQAQAARELLRTYAAWMDSSFRAAQVIDRLQLDMTPRGLLGNVTIASDASRSIIQVDVENGNGDVANDIAREWATLFVEWRNERNATVLRQDRINAEIIDDPTFSLHEPDTDINTIAGGIFGALVGLGIIFLLEFIESGIIRSTQDIDRFLSLPVIGAIPPEG
ncbi:MAG: hypothetical protein GYB68_08820 [Chloroflexi bacterium]|nr:hypothetical protein [Chloroflexota bacterium]